jgi:hypothetical protein
MRQLFVYLCVAGILLTKACAEEERNPSIIDGVYMRMTRTEVKVELAKLKFKITRESKDEIVTVGFVPIFDSVQEVSLFFVEEQLAACASAPAQKEEKQKKPNQIPEPTTASGRGSS